MTPDKFQSLDDVRSAMDAIDRQIVALISERVACARAAAGFKTAAEAVADPVRIQAVLTSRRRWAEDKGLDGVSIEALYRDLIAYCIAEEKKHWDSLSRGDSASK
jgi:isochorismate pyruvate lyase